MLLFHFYPPLSTAVRKVMVTSETASVWRTLELPKGIKFHLLDTLIFPVMREKLCVSQGNFDVVRRWTSNLVICMSLCVTSRTFENEMCLQLWRWLDNLQLPPFWKQFTLKFEMWFLCIVFILHDFMIFLLWFLVLLECIECRTNVFSLKFWINFSVSR